LWDVDFGGSYFNTKLFFSVSPPPIVFTNQTTERKAEFLWIYPLLLNIILLYSISGFGFDLGTVIRAMGMATESQFHVLAVDDSLIDRKLIEKLLKTSSYQGWPNTI
jgi:hypothetical protein